GIIASGLPSMQKPGGGGFFFGLFFSRRPILRGPLAPGVVVGIIPIQPAGLAEIIVISATGLLPMTFALLGRSGNPRLVGTFSGFLNVILFFPSGAIYPVESFPPWLRTFAHFNPETHSVSAIKQILFKGADFAAVSGDIAFLLVFMVLMLVVASFSFKRTL